MKKVAITILFAIACNISFGQTQHVVDSLKNKLATATNDTGRVLIAAQLCWSSTFVKTDSAKKYGELGLKLIKGMHFPRGEANVYLNIGFLNRETGNLPAALGYGLKALRIADAHDFTKEKANCYDVLGGIYYDLGDFARELDYCRRAMKIHVQIKDPLYNGYGNITLAYLELSKIDSAEIYARLCFQRAVQTKLVDVNPSIYRTLGRVQLQLGNMPLALSYLEKSCRIAVKNADHRDIAYGYYITAMVFEKMNEPDSVIFYSRQSINEAETGPFNRFVLSSAELLVNAYQSKGDFKNAFLNQALVIKTKESLFGAGNIQAINEMIARETERQKEIDAQKVAYQNQLKQYALLGGLGVFLLIAIILYRNNRQKHAANMVLERTLVNLKNAQTQLIQSEKMASLGELTAGIAHEIQNPLNFVNNFSDVNREMIGELKGELKNGNIEEALVIAEDLEQNEIKINHHGKRADFIVKGMLEHSRTNTGEKQLTDMNVLCDEFLKLSYHGLRARDKSFNAEMVTHFDPKLPKVNVSQQDIGRVMLNLFNNAFYAVNQKAKTAGPDYKPTVEVTTFTPPSPKESSGTGGWRVIVKDNGVGIPDSIKDKIMQPFFTTKPTGEGTGLGLSLSYDIVVKGHGGKIEINSKEGKFTEFIVSLPLN